MTLIESPPPQRGRHAEIVLRPSWDLDLYSWLVDQVRLEWGGDIDLQQYCAGTPGVWLRHDVELSIEAALGMAAVEKKLGVRASYFLCPDSPALRAGDRELENAALELRGLGHDVGLHLCLEPDALLRADSPQDDDEALRTWDWWTTEHVSYHAPTRRQEGLPPTVPSVLDMLAERPRGKALYHPIASGESQYASDSTGRWRSHEPWRRQPGSRQLQLLTHPFWWAGDPHGLALDGASERFLPKAVAHRAVQDVTDPRDAVARLSPPPGAPGPTAGDWRTAELPIVRDDANGSGPHR